MAARRSVRLCLSVFSLLLITFKCSAAFNVTAIGSLHLGESFSVNVTFHPPAIEGLVWRKSTDVNFQVHTDPQSEHVVDSGRLLVKSDDESVAVIVGSDEIPFTYNSQIDDIAFNTSVFTIHGHFMGRTHLKCYLPQSSWPTLVGPTLAPFNSTYSPAGWTEMPETIKISVVRPDRAVDKVFIALVALLVVCANIGMGCKVDLEVVKEVLRKPFAPAIGFCCQFLIMPLTAFAAIKILGLKGGVAMGFFAAGCAPAGGSSNMYSYLLNGDVSLSVTMTLISTLAAFGMIPLWMYTLGKTFTDEYGIKIPFMNIMITLLCIIIPVGIGLLIQKKRPKLAQFIVKKILKGFFIVIILFFFTFGVWANQYIFSLISPKLILAGCILPYTGFLLAGLVAFICRQPWNRIITIAIEAGIQNTGIPILLLKFSLPQPEADLSVVAPVVVSMFMPIPLWIAVTVVEIRRRCCKKGKSASGTQYAPTNQEDEKEDGDLIGNSESGLTGEDEPTFKVKEREMVTLNGKSDTANGAAMV